MKTRAYILNRLRSHKKDLEPFGIKTIGINCSYAREEQTPRSQIYNLVELKAQHENFDNYMALCDYLESLFKGIKAEIVTKSGLSPYIGPKILNEVIYV